MLFSAALFASLVASAAAHATFQELWVNGVDQGHNCARLPQSNSPVTSVTSNDIACNANAQSSPNLCSLNAGDSVTVEMHQQPGDRSCANEAIGGAHNGPVMVYLAKVSNALSAVGSSQSWFKVAEAGLVSNNPDYWATDVLNDNCGHFTFTMPAVEPGQYLLRAEVIALHVASSSGGAQFYMTCYQLNVGGTGTATPAGVSLPGAYKASDPGILINIHTQLNSYVIPGPTPYALPSPAVASTAWPKAATYNTAANPKSDPPMPAATAAAPAGTTGAAGSGTPAGSAASPQQTQFGQCGGQGWTGPTACVSGSSCVAMGAYYSQCQ